MKLQLKLPSVATTVAALVLGVLTVLNTTTFQPGPPWQTGINIALLAGAAFGVAPLLGKAWASALNLTVAQTSLVTGVLSFLQLWQQSEPLSTTLHAVIVGVITVAAGLGFGVNIAIISGKAKTLIVATFRDEGRW